jgi:hypothetical protein
VIQRQVQLDSANRIFVHGINDEEVIQHDCRAAEVEFSESVEQTASDDVYVYLSTKLIEGRCFFRSVSPVWVLKFGAFFPRLDWRCVSRAAGEVVDDMFVDFVPYLDWDSEKAAGLWNYGIGPGKGLFIILLVFVSK